MSGLAHIRSGWADPIGAPLTDAIIRRYEKLGYYGGEREAAATSGIVHRCRECETKKRVVFYRFRYLPTPGFYCPSCLETHRAARDKEREEKEKWRALVIKEYV